MQKIITLKSLNLEYIYKYEKINMRMKKMKMYKAKDVDSYIASSGREASPKLKEIRKIIKSTIPKAEEGISRGVPSIKNLKKT